MSTSLNLIQNYNSDSEDEENEHLAIPLQTESKFFETVPINPKFSTVSTISVNSAPVVFYSVMTIKYF